jgi:rod shape-determining protein MreD
MAIDTLRRAAVFMALVLAQALVFNYIHLFGYATVLLYVYFVVMFPRNYPRWAILLWSFFLGLSADLFTNTPGMAAASLTLVGFLQPYLLELFLPREAPEKLKSAMSTLGATKFFLLVLILVWVYCLLFFTIESFGFFNWLQWLYNVVGTTALTVLVLMTVESIRR